MLYPRIQERQTIPEAISRQNLGRMLSYRGAWRESKKELDLALKLFEERRTIQYTVALESVAWGFLALHFLLIGRSSRLFKFHNLELAIESATRAL
jgi:hypothetical protein